jgi:hypothetical protein
VQLRRQKDFGFSYMIGMRAALPTLLILDFGEEL